MSWTCQRVENKLKCGFVNENRKRRCAWCGKPRPARKRPASDGGNAVSNLDFRVEQTYGEIQQLVRDAAEGVLMGNDPDPPNWHDRWASETAARIAEQAMLHMDAAE